MTVMCDVWGLALSLNSDSMGVTLERHNKLIMLFEFRNAVLDTENHNVHGAIMWCGKEFRL